MTELYLKFRDETGENRRVLVTGEKFVVGRQADCDLSIANNKLSRQHVKIDSFGEVFVVSDRGSSNGTTLGGAELREPVALKNGDVLNLGGGLDIHIEIISDQPKASRRNAANADLSAARAADQSAPAGGGSSIPTAVFFIAPALALVFVLCGGGLFLYFSNTNAGNNDNREINYYPTPDETPEETKNSPTPKTISTSGGNTPATPADTPDAPEISDDKKKIETNSAAFLQRIALNDPSAFLRTTEIDIVSQKIAPFKGSSAFAENLKAVKGSASQFQALAQSKGLKPQFLAAAALAAIGTGRGDPLEVAKTMLPVFGELRVTLANNLADDNLLMVAAYDQGKAGKFKDLRNVLEALAKKNPNVAPREIRTIWFLKKQGKITDAEFDFALRFLAVGTIAQNPKDFAVNAEAVIF